MRCIICLLLLMMKGIAQTNHPVLVNMQLNPPYSLYLSDYSAADVQRMQVHLLLKDLTEFNYKCRLRLKIEGPGITLQSKAGFYVPPIILNGGEMTTISGPELADYFNPQNLFIQGLDNNAFTKNGAKLPEGIYKFTIEVLDYTRNTVISNPGNAIVATFLSYPPIINLPMANTKVDAMDPQNVMFQWMPRHTASMNAAFNVVYKFRLVEMIPADRDPNDALRTLRPIYEVITPQTMLVYGAGEPALTPGNNYAVQVQAIEADGKDMFVNDGFSEAVKFTYGEKCSVPQQIVAAFAGKNELKLTWASTTSQQGYTVRYREAGDNPSQWYEDNSFQPQITISGLKPGKKYEYQVKAQCIWGYGDYSPIASFTMPNETMTSGDFVCGMNPNQSKITNTTNVKSLAVQDTIWAADFRVIIMSISSTGDAYTGTGYIDIIPFLKIKKLRVTFNNIRVNTDKRMYDGVMDLSHESRQQVEADFNGAIDKLLKQIDDIVKDTSVEKLFSLNPDAFISDIERIKGFDDLDETSIDRLSELQSKFEELREYQRMYPGMTPEDRATMGDKIRKDLGQGLKAVKEGIEAIKQLIKELLGIYRKAVTALAKEKQSKADGANETQLFNDKKAALDKLIQTNNKSIQKNNNANNDGIVLLAQQIEEVVDASKEATGTGNADIDKYLELLQEKNIRTILSILVNNKDEAKDKKVVAGLKVDGKPATTYLSGEKKDENTTVTAIKQSVMDWLLKLIEKH